MKDFHLFLLSLPKYTFNDISFVFTVNIFQSEFHFNAINFEQQECTVERVHYVDV